MRKFGLSRIAFRELALRGEIPGVTKALLVNHFPLLQTDPLADFLTTIRNASRAAKSEVRVPWSRMRSRCRPRSQE